VELNIPNLSDYDLGKIILISLGEAEEYVDALPEEKVIEATTYSSMQQIDSYFKRDNDNNSIELSKYEFLNEIFTLDALSIAPSLRYISNPSYIEYPRDGYVKITTYAYKKHPYYALPGRDYFTIVGRADWVKSPVNKETDILAIASSGNVDNNYPSCGAIIQSGECAICHENVTITKTAYLNDESSQLYVYNPSIYGLAVESDIGATNLIAGDNHGIAGVNNNGIPRSFVAYYGISTQEDVSSQVGYSHKTIGLGKPTVSASSSGALGFSIGIAGSKSDYLGRSFTLYYG